MLENTKKYIKDVVATKKYFILGVIGKCGAKDIEKAQKTNLKQ
jgi:hypothetical protein